MRFFLAVALMFGLGNVAFAAAPTDPATIAELEDVLGGLHIGFQDLPVCLPMGPGASVPTVCITAVQQIIAAEKAILAPASSLADVLAADQVANRLLDALVGDGGLPPPIPDIFRAAEVKLKLLEQEAGIGPPPSSPDAKAKRSAMRLGMTLIEADNRLWGAQRQRKRLHQRP